MPLFELQNILLNSMFVEYEVFKEVPDFFDGTFNFSSKKEMTGIRLMSKYAPMLPFKYQTRYTFFICYPRNLVTKDSKKM